MVAGRASGVPSSLVQVLPESGLVMQPSIVIASFFS
jgi:hypothetical protein